MQKSILTLLIFLLLFVLLILSACSKSPEPISYGQDECVYCRMLITDNRYGAEIVSGKGKTYKFDSLECLVGFALEKNLIGDETHRFFVTNFSHPGDFTNARNANYVHNENFKSPMGLNVMAFESKDGAEAFTSDNGGRNLVWINVIDLVKQKDTLSGKIDH